MQKLKKGQVLTYPIDLYLSKKHILLILALGLLIFPLYYYCVPIMQEEGGWVAVIILLLLIILIVLGVIVSLLALLSGKPALQISTNGLTILQVLRKSKQKSVLWRDVECIDISYQVYGRTETWALVIQPKQGKVIQYPLKTMRYKDTLLNEMEIYHIVKLAFEGKPAIHYQSIEMERIKLITKKTKWLLLIIFILLSLVYFFQ